MSTERFMEKPPFNPDILTVYQRYHPIVYQVRTPFPGESITEREFITSSGQKLSVFEKKDKDGRVNAWRAYVTDGTIAQNGSAYLEQGVIQQFTLFSSNDNGKLVYEIREGEISNCYEMKQEDNANPTLFYHSDPDLISTDIRKKYFS